MQPKAGLIRFVVGPDDRIYPDILGKLPGRGMYVTADRACLKRPQKVSSRAAAKQAGHVPDGLVDEVERNCVATLST